MKPRSLHSTLFRLVGILAIQSILIFIGVVFVSISLYQRTILERQHLLISSLVNQGNLFLENTEQVMVSQALFIDEFTSQEQTKFLEQIREEYPRFTSLQFIDSNGIVVSESTAARSLINLDLSGEPFFENAQQIDDAHFSDPFISLTSGDTALYVAVAIEEAGKLKGVLVGEISLALLQEVVLEQANLGEETVSFIVDKRGTLLAHPNQEWVQERRNFAHMPLVRTGLTGQETARFFYDDLQNMWMVGTVQTMKNGWPVLTIQPIVVAARPMLTLIVLASFAFVFSAFLFIVVVRRNVDRITRPLSDLVERADALAKGDFEESLTIPEPVELVEINSLENSFNRMVAAVQERDQALASQLAELKQAEAEMRQVQAFLNNVLENIPHIIFVKDAAELRYYLLNKATEEVLGLQREELLGKNDYDFFSPEEAEFFIQKDREVLASRALVDITEESVETKDFGIRYFHTKKVPIVDENGEVNYLLGISEDITERKQAEEKIRAYAAELERSNKELQSFAYVSSHDLQEPLRKIQTFSDRLLQKYSDVLDERGVDYLRRMEVAAARMQSLIIDLLAYSRVMTQAKNFTKVDLSQIMAEVKSDLDVLIEEVNGRVELNSLLSIEADPTQMRQLFQNLINNALKYHKKGTPPMVKIEGQTINDNLYQVQVTDNGIGFDEKYVDRIFGVFQRLHGRHEYEGTGVGLAICQLIVQRHHGEITAKSSKGAGATFIVRLPIQQPDNNDFSPSG